MRTTKLRLAVALGALAVLGTARADEAARQDLLAARAPSLVHLKYVLKRGPSERKRQADGVLVDASGLAVFSTTAMGGRASRGVKPSPTDLKIVFGTDPKEFPSVLVAQDTNVDLAWVQILDLEGRAVTPVDFSAGAELQVGQAVLQVARKSASFDFAPVVWSGYVTSRVEKPRPLWGIAGDAHFAGLPAFDLAGKIVGLVTFQQGTEGAEEGMMGMRLDTFLLPPDAVGKSLVEAKKHVAEAVAKAKAPKEPEPAAMEDAPKPAPDAPKAPEKPGEGK